MMCGMTAIRGLSLPAPPAITNVAWLCWREARPIVQVMFQLRFVTGALFAVAASPQGLPGIDDIRMAVGAAAWLCAIWHVYLLNGVCDQTEDRLNGSARPLATGALPPGAARFLLRVLAFAALACGAAVSVGFAVLVAAMLGLGWLYSAGPRPQKASVPGFMAVVVAGGVLTYLAGWFAGGGGLPNAQVCVLAVAMSLWMGTAGMTKDLSDVVGDRAAGRRTLPILLGEARARIVVAAMAAGVGVAALFSAYRVAPALLLAGGILLGGALLVAHALLETGRPRRPYRLFMLTQYAVHVAAVGQVMA